MILRVSILSKSTSLAPDAYFGLPVSLLFSASTEIPMPIWKVLFIAVFGCVCLGLALGTIVIPLALDAEDYRWLWFSGFLVGSICMGSLFALFLKHQDRSFDAKPRRS